MQGWPKTITCDALAPLPKPILSGFTLSAPGGGLLYPRWYALVGRDAADR